MSLLGIYLVPLAYRLPQLPNRAEIQSSMYHEIYTRDALIYRDGQHWYLASPDRYKYCQVDNNANTACKADRNWGHFEKTKSLQFQFSPILFDSNGLCYHHLTCKEQKL